MDSRKLMAVVAVSVMVLAGFLATAGEYSGEDKPTYEKKLNPDNPIEISLMFDIDDRKGQSYYVQHTSFGFENDKTDYTELKWEIKAEDSEDSWNPIPNGNNPTNVVLYALFPGGDKSALYFNPNLIPNQNEYRAELRIQFTIHETDIDIIQYLYYDFNAVGYKGNVEDLTVDEDRFDDLTVGGEWSTTPAYSIEGSPITASDYIWAAIGLPEGIQINKDTGELRGVPVKATGGKEYPATIIATERSTHSSYKATVTLSVDDVVSDNLSAKVILNDDDENALENPSQFYVIRGDDVKLDLELRDSRTPTVKIFGEDGNMTDLVGTGSDGHYSYDIPTSLGNGAFVIRIIDSGNYVHDIVMYVIDQIRDVNAEIIVEGVTS